MSNFKKCKVESEKMTGWMMFQTLQAVFLNDETPAKCFIWQIAPRLAKSSKLGIMCSLATHRHLGRGGMVKGFWRSHLIYQMEGKQEVLNVAKPRPTSHGYTSSKNPCYIRHSYGGLCYGPFFSNNPTKLIFHNK